MSSTEFSIGMVGNRNSSKVLKPPGGGSSDIFGRGSFPISSNGTANDKAKIQDCSMNTQNRLFGMSSEPTVTPVKSQVKSNVFETTQNAHVTKSTTKPCVRRNPITGEEIEYYPDNYQKADKNDNEQNDTKETDVSNGETVSEQNNEEEEKKVEIPRKHIQTSIRVRNPPGGKSSGIF